LLNIYNYFVNRKYSTKNIVQGYDGRSYVLQVFSLAGLLIAQGKGLRARITGLLRAQGKELRARKTGQSAERRMDTRQS
jgi:hypothetical protein